MRVRLTLAGFDALSPRHFSVFEGMSTPFDVSVVAVSEIEDLDLETLIGAPAVFSVDAGGSARTRTGIVGAAEQLPPEESGLSTYRVRVVPELAMLAHRSRSRVYQHLSVPEIVEKVLAA